MVTADGFITEVKALRARIAELEDKRPMVFMGPHDPGVASYRGALSRRLGVAEAWRFAGLA